MAVKPEQLNSGLHHHKIFIQSTSQGSRCLKAGTKILYLKEVLRTFHTYLKTQNRVGSPSTPMHAYIERELLERER